MDLTPTLQAIRRQQKQLKPEQFLRCSEIVELCFISNMTNDISISDLYSKDGAELVIRPIRLEQLKISEPLKYDRFAKLQNMRVKIFNDIRDILVEELGTAYSEELIFQILNIKANTKLWTHKV